MDITDTSLYESRSDTKTPHQSKPKDVSTIWGSGESGYFTTPTPGGSVEIESGSFNKRKNDSLLHLPGETPRNTGARISKRGSSLTDVINNYENDSLLVNNEQSCENIKTDLINEQRYNFNQQNLLPHTITTSNQNTNPVFLINEFEENLEQSQVCIIRNESKSCPVTPIKNTVLIKHTSFSPMPNYSGLTYEPKTPVYFFSPIINELTDSNSVQKSLNKKSSVKRPNLSAISEKNSILYNDRPTTPPKHRTPVKSHVKRLLSTSAKTKLDFDCREKLDIIGKLGERDLGHKILELLYREDLCRVCLVSKRWRDICLKDCQANRRRKMYLEERRFDKENIINNTKKISERELSSSRKEFLEIQNKNATASSSVSISQQPLSPPVSPKRANHMKFVKAGKKLEPRRCLRKCPKCAGPARPSHLIQTESNKSSISKKTKSSHRENEIGIKRTRREPDSALNDSKILDFEPSTSIITNPFISTPKNNKRLAIGASLPFYNNVNDTLCSDIDYSNASTSNIKSVDNSLNNNSELFDNSIFSTISQNEQSQNLSYFINDTSNNKSYGIINDVTNNKSYKTPVKSIGANKQDRSNISIVSDTSDIYYCSSDKCGYVFCELCTGPAHAEGACPPTQKGLQAPSPTRNETQPNVTDRIGSKKSRKNLRRLLE